LTASFVIVPIVLLEGLDLDTNDHWRIYLPALLGSIPFMAIMVVIASSPKRNKWVFFVAICLLILAQLLMVIRPVTSLMVATALFFFFWGFNTLEALLPSLVSRLAPAAGKGSAMGVYNTFQFMGVFFGGFFGGLLYGQFGVTATFIVMGLVLVGWAWFAFKSEPFRLLDSLTVKINPEILDSCRAAFRAIEGVEEVIVFEGETVAYLKVDKSRLDTAALDALVST
jgi:MFS family permease